MLGSINSSLKVEKSRLFLCRPDRTELGELHEAYGKELRTSYNGIHELSFSIPYRKVKNKKFIVNPNFDLIKGNYLIRYVKHDVEEYFIIDKPSNNGSDGKDVKSVHCYLLPYSLGKKLVRSYSETKPLYDPVGSNGLLNDTLLRKTDWSVGHVDADILIKYRTVDVSEQSMIEFISDLCDAFDCMVVWDTVNKQVNFYVESHYGSDKGLLIEEGKYLKTIGEEPDFDNVITRLYVYGKEDISINKFNPSGTDYIENFSYYLYPFERDANRNIIKRSNFMSDALCHGLLDYQKAIADNKSNFTNLINQKETLQTNSTIKTNELATLQIELLIIEDNIDVKKSLGQDYSALNTQKAAKQSQINTKNLEIASLKSQIANVDTQITTIKSNLDISKYLTTGLISELVDDFTHERILNNEFISDEQELYTFGESELFKICQPLFHYQIDLVNFNQVVQCQRDWGKLKYGDIVTLRYPKYGVDLKARIVSVSENEDSNSVQIEIANTSDINNGFTKLKDLYQKASSSAITVDMGKGKWNNSSAKLGEVYDSINADIDATKRRITGGVNESIEITRKGLIAKNPDFPNEMLILQSGVLALSQTGGETWNTAIKPDRIIADVVKGKLLAGVNLTIENDSGLYKFDSQGFTIKGGSMTIEGGLPSSQLDPTFKDGLVELNKDYTNGIRLDTTSGLIVTRSDNKVMSILNATDGIKIQTYKNSAWQDSFFFDVNTSNLIINGEVNALALKVNGQDVLTADKLKINGGYIDKIRVQQLDASTAKITTAQIESLEVGKNVIMGANASISWNQVSSQPFIPTSADQIGGVTTSSPRLTYIDQNGAYIGMLEANQIKANGVTAGALQIGGNLSVTGNVNGGLTVYGGIYIPNSTLQIDSAGYFSCSGAFSGNLNGFVFTDGTNRLFGSRSEGYTGSAIKFLQGGGIQSRNYTDTAYANVSATEFVVNSRREDKKNIANWDGDALALILSTPLRQFQYNNEEDWEVPHIGFILDEAPLEMISVDGQGILSNQVAALSCKAIQQLNDKITALEAKVNGTP